MTRAEAINDLNAIKEFFEQEGEAYPVSLEYAIGVLKNEPQKAIAQVTFDEEKLREIVKEAVDRFKEEYEIVDRPRGEWKEKTKFLNEDDNPIIEEWQSAKCSVCGKYHTTPYLYYFDNFNFCPNCGAQMKGADKDAD